ncbi:chorismate mutase [Saccharothrix longispora]|uniref:chorismate mutase n=1 Tax=Saccharothrix longispora TaxID=33920 RepID=UPI0028FD7C56|nr:chorismate mutase [Saccharothrix longispora]MBY8850725.1 chorismate mutase [Saccharothrix sp. MB29]MDU0290761.1 chorismate mutase [Saccharothrix longispora]
MVGAVRAVRGAVQVDADDPVAIGEGTIALIEAMLAENGLVRDEVISVLFTVTPDLVSAYPATSARSGPLDGVPVMCATEIAVPGGLPRVVRAMAHVVVPEPARPVRHVYLGGAAVLRPDLTGAGSR